MKPNKNSLSTKSHNKEKDSFVNLNQKIEEKAQEVETKVEPIEFDVVEEKPVCDFSLISRVTFRNYKRGDVIPHSDSESVLGCHEKNYVVKILNKK